MLVFLDAGFSSQKLAHCLNSNRQKAVFIQTAFSITAKTILKFNSHTKQSITGKSLIFSILLLIIVIISV